jgi:hypothetical protein
MSSAITARFAKTRGCPSAEMLELNIYAEGSAQMSEYIASHLANCDFCCAEAYFLAKHKNRSPITEAPQMPGSLRILAEALLKRGVETDRFEVGEGRG